MAWGSSSNSSLDYDRRVSDFPSYGRGSPPNRNTYDRHSKPREPRGNMGRNSNDYNNMDKSSKGRYMTVLTQSYTWFLTFRILAIIFNIVMIGCAGVYLSALVMSRNTVAWLPMLLIVALPIATVWMIFGCVWYRMSTTNGKRFNYLASLDLVLAACYAGLAGYFGTMVAAISCQKEQFTTTHLNRYNMGIFDRSHDFKSWAKSSKPHCDQSRALFVCSMLVSIFLIGTAIVGKTHHHQKQGRWGRD